MTAKEIFGFRWNAFKKFKAFPQSELLPSLVSFIPRVNPARLGLNAAQWRIQMTVTPINSFLTFSDKNVTFKCRTEVTEVTTSVYFARRCQADSDQNRRTMMTSVAYLGYTGGRSLLVIYFIFILYITLHFILQRK